MIDAPKHFGDWPDRALDCEMAMEDAFLAVAERLQVSGLALEEAATQLEQGVADQSHWLAEDLRQVVTWAVQAGWRGDEVNSGIHSLVENYRLSVEARRETEDAIRLVWETPE